VLDSVQDLSVPHDLLFTSHLVFKEPPPGSLVPIPEGGQFQSIYQLGSAVNPSTLPVGGDHLSSEERILSADNWR